jgi:hypothetical protein
MATTELRAKVTADGRGYLKTMQRIGAATMQAVGYLAAAGAAGAAAYAALVKSSADYMDAISKGAKRTGADVAEFQRQLTAAALADISAQDVETAYKGMSNVLTDAANGSKTANDTLKRLGLTQRELANLDPSQQYNRLSEALADVDNATTRAALAQDVFGRSGTKLLTLLANGRDGYRQALQERERLGPLFTRQQLESAEEFNDSLTRIGMALKIGGAALVADQLPILAEGFNRVAASIGAIASSPEFAALSQQMAALAGNAVGVFGTLTGIDVDATKGVGALADALQRVNAELNGIRNNGSLQLLADVVRGLAWLVGKNVQVAQFIPGKLVDAATEVATNPEGQFAAAPASNAALKGARKDRMRRMNFAFRDQALRGEVTPEMLAAAARDDELAFWLEKIAANTGPLLEMK